MQQRKINIAALMRTRIDAILEKWVNARISNGSVEHGMERETLLKYSRRFLDVFVEAFETSGDDMSTPECQELLQVMAEGAAERAKIGFLPTDMVHYLISFREIFMDFLAEQFQGDLQRFIDIRKQVMPLFDRLTLTNFDTFVREREEIIRRQQQDILEISTPVIQVWAGVIALPIIGTLDSERTQLLMENMLQAIAGTRSELAILDISGVPIVDTNVAQHLLKTVSAARLMGAECIISGIRAEIAQTIVELGIDISSVVTQGSFYGALRWAFSRIGITITEGQ